MYYKEILNSKLILAALGDPITDVEMLRCVFETFKVQTDLKDACCDWDRQAIAPTWAMLTTYFTIEIQQNQTDSSKVKQQGEANEVLQQVEQQ